MTKGAEFSLLIDEHAKALDMLRRMDLLGPDSTYYALAKELGVSERTVSDALKALDSAYEEKSEGGHLIDRHRNRNYSLTAAGRRVAEALKEGRNTTIDALKDSLESHREVWIPISNDCYTYFDDLASDLEHKDITLLPSPRRSSDLHLHTRGADIDPAKGDAPEYALYSACIRRDDLRASARLVTSIDGDSDAQVIVMRTEPFKIMAKESAFGTQAGLHLADLWAVAHLIVPDGGAVPDYLDQAEAGWYRRRRYIRANDLDSCLKCLVHTPRRATAMLVHGSVPVAAGFRTYEIEGGPDLVAVSGLFSRLSRMAGDRRRSRRQLVHEVIVTAQRRWVDLAPTREVAA